MRKSVLLVVIFVLGFLFSGCGPEKDNPDVVRINESCDVYITNVFVATVKYDSCDWEELEDDSARVLIKETITITPVTKMNLDSKDFLLKVEYEPHENGENTYFTDEEFNNQKNQFSVLGNEIVEETTYVFCFVIPKEKNNFKYNQVGISLLVFDSYLLVYNFN